MWDEQLCAVRTKNPLRMPRTPDRRAGAQSPSDPETFFVRGTADIRPAMPLIAVRTERNRLELATAAKRTPGNAFIRRINSLSLTLSQADPLGARLDGQLALFRAAAIALAQRAAD